MIEKKCLNCGKLFLVRPSRVDIAKFCSTACKGEYSKKHSGSIRICPVCKREFYAKGNPHGRGLYCSRKCSSYTRRRGRVIICETCGKAVYKSPAFFSKSAHHFCSTKCHNEWQGRDRVRYICKICGNEFSWSASKEQEYPIKYCSMECRNNDPEYIRGLIALNARQLRKKKPNKLELAGRRILEAISVNFEEQVLMYDKFCVDVLLTNYPIIVQWDGDYWHGNPGRFPELDKRQEKRCKLDRSQDAYLLTCGYTVLRFWESDVMKNPNQVTAKIERILDDYNKGAISGIA